jgi:hypothetical protein
MPAVTRYSPEASSQPPPVREAARYRDSRRPGPLYHGSAAGLRPGDMIESGHPGDPNSVAGYVYCTASQNLASVFAGQAARRLGTRECHLYEVQPLGQVEPDPHSLAGLRTTRPLLIVDEHEPFAEARASLRKAGRSPGEIDEMLKVLGSPLPGDLQACLIRPSPSSRTISSRRR